MRHLILALVSALFFTHSAQAQSLVATSNILVRALDRSLNFTSDTTTSIRDMKVVLQARDDAASFVATKGELRGAHLEAALITIRDQFPTTLLASDLELAQAILAL